jgi:hypothetical protein
VKIKGYVLVACTTAFLSWLVFSPDDQAPERESSESATGTQPRSLPREPETGPKIERSGIAGRRGRWGDVPSVDYERKRQTPSMAYRRYAPGTDPMERYSFRPLTEREKARLERERPMPGYYDDTLPQYPSEVYSQSQQAQQEYPGPDAARGTYAQPDAPRPWYGLEGYGLRPERRDGYSPDPWIIPYADRQAPGSRPLDSAAPWSDPPTPQWGQWGSRPPEWGPPEDRMYPSLSPYSDSRLTAR